MLGREATTLRSIETQPFDWMICLVSYTSRLWRVQKVSRPLRTGESILAISFVPF